MGSFGTDRAYVAPRVTSKSIFFFICNQGSGRLNSGLILQFIGEYGINLG